MDHLTKLEKQHQELNKQIAILEKTGIFEDNKLHNLKKEKLRIKDEIKKIKERTE